MNQQTYQEMLVNVVESELEKKKENYAAEHEHEEDLIPETESFMQNGATPCMTKQSMQSSMICFFVLSRQ